MRHLQNPFKAFAVFAAMIALMAFLGSCGPARSEEILYYKYMIKESSGRTNWTDSYSEINGCVTFVDECENPTRVCGTYTIVTQK
jgi:hypothetical protein